MAAIRLRNYESADAENLNRIAISAFADHCAPHQSDHVGRPADVPEDGFAKAYDAPPIFGVAYAVYTKAL